MNEKSVHFLAVYEIGDETGTPQGFPYPIVSSVYSTLHLLRDYMKSAGLEWVAQPNRENEKLWQKFNLPRKVAFGDTGVVGDVDAQFTNLWVDDGGKVYQPVLINIKNPFPNEEEGTMGSINFSIFNDHHMRHWIGFVDKILVIDFPSYCGNLNLVCQAEYLAPIDLFGITGCIMESDMEGVWGAYAPNIYFLSEVIEPAKRGQEMKVLNVDLSELLSQGLYDVEISDMIQRAIDDMEQDEDDEWRTL